MNTRAINRLQKALDKYRRHDPTRPLTRRLKKRLNRALREIWKMSPQELRRAQAEVIPGLFRFQVWNKIYELSELEE